MGTNVQTQGCVWTVTCTSTTSNLHDGVGGSGVQPILPTPVAFAVGGTCLFRRVEFLAGGGFDPLYEPFYWEDIDLCWQAWSAGRRVLYQPASVVEHHHRIAATNQRFRKVGTNESGAAGNEYLHAVYAPSVRARIASSVFPRLSAARATISR